MNFKVEQFNFHLVLTSEHSKATETDETGRPREIDCLSCSSDFDTEADIDGRPFCQTEGTPRSCPVFANAGCFKSKALVDMPAAYEEHYYKGCSTFKLKDDWEEDQPECTSAIQNGEHWLMCDNICNGKKDEPCNTGSTTGQFFRFDCLLIFSKFRWNKNVLHL